MHRAIVIILAAFCAVQWAGATVPAFVPSAVDSGGPDPYGYTWKDSNDPGGPVYAWKNISGIGTAVAGLLDDNYVGPFPIGFSFPYYWYNVSQYWIYANGYISFGQPPSPPNYGNLNCYKTDLTFLDPYAECFRWNNQDSLVVSYINVPLYESGGSHTFQIILDRLTGDITYQYGTQVVQAGPIINIQSLGGNFTLNYMVYQDPTPNSAVTFFSPNAPTLDVNLTPVNPPIAIPANGGSFNFNASVLRPMGPQSPFYVWARIKNPNGSYTTPTLGPVAINPPVGTTITRQRTQNVPGSWPAGEYTYLGYANMTYSYPAIDSSGFTFTKSTVADGRPWISDVTCSGEPFPGELSQRASIPSGLDLDVNPNPFNPSTSISFSLPEAQKVLLNVYDVQGRLVATLINGVRQAGAQQVTFDGSKLVSGIYLYTLQAGQYSVSGKMVLIK